VPRETLIQLRKTRDSRVSRETLSIWGKRGRACARSGLWVESVPRETLAAICTESGIDFANAFAYPDAQHTKIKSWDVSSQLPTRRVASARLRPPSTLLPHLPLPRSTRCWWTAIRIRTPQAV